MDIPSPTATDKTACVVEVEETYKLAAIAAKLLFPAEKVITHPPGNVKPLAKVMVRTIPLLTVKEVVKVILPDTFVPTIETVEPVPAALPKATAGAEELPTIAPKVYMSPGLPILFCPVVVSMPNWFNWFKLI